MARVDKSAGVTASERYLARLCEHTFLSLWSYPNLHTDEGRRNGKGQGKELCDLLVVFGDHVLIFSDKDVAFKDTGNLEVDWGRWVKRAVLKSARQIYGAEKWINAFPDRIYLDCLCENQLPLKLPAPEKTIIHRIVVAQNAASQFRRYVRGRGTLIINPGVIGDSHIHNPFHLGQIDPQRGYVHVFDNIALDIVIRELDTVSDFVTYLSRKEAFITSGRLVTAAGEEELLAFYLRNLDHNDEHDFVIDEPDAVVTLGEGLWDGLNKLPQYAHSKEQNRVSYFWDRLIERIAPHVLHGTLEHASTDSVDENALALRVMANETRVERRVLSRAFKEKLECTGPRDRGVRTMFSPSRGGVGYVLFIYPAPGNFDEYARYRDERGEWLFAYCQAFKAKHPEVQIVVGIACEPKGSRGGSEDLIYIDTTAWTDEDMVEAQQIRTEMGLLLDENVRETHRQDWEFPIPEGSKPSVRERSKNIHKNKENRRKMIKLSRKRNRRK